METLKEKQTLFIGIAVIILLLVGGGVYILSFQNKASVQEKVAIEEEAIGMLSPEELGLEMETDIKDGVEAVKFIFNNVKGIKRIEWQAAYDADIPPAQRVEGGDGKVTQSFSGEKNITPEETTYETEYKHLGTCSSGRCRPDTGVTQVQLIVKVIKIDGKVYQSEKTFDLE